jgi:plastocyanin
MRPSRSILVLAALCLAGLGAATAGVVAHAGTSKTTVTVTEREFRLSLSRTSASAGVTRIAVRNAGKFRHALALRGNGVSRRTRPVEPGKTAVLVVTLRAGTYTLWCPVPGHAAQGMRATLKVGRDDATTGTGTAGTTTGVEDDPITIPGY